MVESFHLHFSLTSNNLTRKFDVYTSHTSPTLSYLSFTMKNLLHCIIFTVFCILIFIPSSHCDDALFEECRRIYPLSCGSHSELNISYPFWVNGRSRRCGRAEFELTCEEDSIHPVLNSPPQKFRVLAINTTDQTVTISRKDLPGDFSSCIDGSEVSVNFNRFLYSYSSNVRNLSLFYNCTDETQLGRNNYTCYQQGIEVRRGFYTIDGELDYFPNHTDTSTCSEVTKVPIRLIDGHVNSEAREFLVWLETNLYMGLEVKYDAENGLCSACQLSGGICGSTESNPGKFLCLCRDKTHPHACPGNSLYLGRKLGTGVASAIITIIIISIMLCICRRKKMLSIMTNFLSRNLTKNVDFEAFIRDCGSIAPKRYSYSEVKRMTNSFKDKLGQGGYGGVYKGKSLDGNIVAVKLLNASKGNGQEFINEVASISKTSHVNVVRLLGFCLEGNKRALIYEFMVNGSLEKFIYNEKNLQASQCLGWEKMYEIAIGIARGLEYLHRGCSTRILHFDIKPHNILLDENLCPKISDFGLAKLCLNKESIVSMLEARGTIGYIAPEVFMRNVGEVSHKSDVYSYGMMILEMVGGRKSHDVEGALHSSEMYFPHWIYKHLEQGKELNWHGVNSSEENEIAKKMIIVGLWCIQTRPSDRPSMNKVLDLLQAGSEDLLIPPEPFLFSSSSRPPIYSSTVSMS
ncbi:LEAF RUST 10 DISEASE-RESISTANCE LOCUS RECEPTOR-LIKE PROTEIN KINASE-like 2.3 [Mangifera indica]|uniref:LEAF RUST 10 DISEASE-RESISTANCE LOCUS RECEPTOR-LIKE PROTEIN KINASE-like 2.3 n=1 Tax=Mangifera indica TaxID=29780 RepID=UPI001CFBCE72|nr:LEAF RUST 10 DISEASE-RESISTANCE LOCUS RECEPTOR-LIKE PROTEIN KINASE-like 2.3 [Mangifera indica]